MITIREVAKRAKVSVGTVSNVLAGSGSVRPELRKRVDEAMRDLDYQPNQIARSLKTRTTKTLGTVVSDITNPFFPQLIRGAEDAALERGFLLMTLNTDDHAERERRALSLLRARKVDGILLVTADNEGAAHIYAMQELGTPVVCLDRVPEGAALDAVCVDNVKGTRMCMHHLIAKGHQRIGIVTGPEGLQTARERLQGYLEVMRESGIGVDERLVRYGDFRLESGYRLAKELLLESEAPTAIFAANAMMGFGAVRALRELGLRCPQDVSLAVFDDSPFGEAMHPRLTVVAQPAYEMGRRGAELLIARVEHEDLPSGPVRVELVPELIVRESTAPPPR